MESSFLGLVVDSSVIIAAERKKQPIPEFIGDIFHAYGPLDLALSPITVAELVHGITVRRHWKLGSDASSLLKSF